MEGPEGELPAELRACAVRAHAPGAADPGALTECEAKLLRDAARARRAWIDEHGRIALEPGDFVVAFSDLHGDARMLQLHLRNAGLVGLVGGAYKWLNPRAVVVICGDVVDDSYSGACHHRLVAARPRCAARRALVAAL
jgi:hypothetical protein